MDKFLEQVARYYRQKYGAQLGQFTFLLPNQRSCLFFKRYLLTAANTPVEMPEITTLAYFMAKRSGLREGSRNELLFTLYNAYLHTLQQHRPGTEPRDYDRFLFWGSMMVDDFDEIDFAQADAQRIFTNMRNMREIAADFLTDEQKRAIREMWGETEFTRDIENFWYHVHPQDGAEMKTRRNFVSMWELMYDMYSRYQTSLHEQGIGSRGLQVKLSLENMKAQPIEDEHFAVIGFSNVSNAERSLFDLLKRRSTVDFFWDFHSPLFAPDSPFVQSNRALQLIAKLQQTYPEPDDFEYRQPPFPDTIDVIGLPSKIDQAKRAAVLVGQLEDPTATDIRTAVVLPDTSILQSFLLGLPSNVKAVNVTMDVPFNQSGFASFLRVAIRLQTNAKQRGNRWMYFYEYVLAVLSNPHLNLFAQKEAEQIRRSIEREGLYNLDAEELAQKYPRLAFIFKPMREIASVESSYAYVDGLIGGMRAELVAQLGDAAEASFEVHILDGFAAKLQEIKDLIAKYNITIRETTYLQMFEHILRAEPLPMTGTPLRGVQAMGVLETRCLDFDNIIFLSMNERTYPRRHYVRTLIPNVVRYGYGLAPIEQAESFYGYYFYRAISSAKRVAVYYDARVGFAGSGEMSRYLNQLIYVQSSHTTINHITTPCKFTPIAKRVFSVAKDERVMELLNVFKSSGDDAKYLSASSLKTYLNCPLRFYFKYVERIKEEEELKNYVDEAKMGTIYHNTMEELFKPYESKPITEREYETIVADYDHVAEVVEQQVAKEGFGWECPVPDKKKTFEYIILVSNITRQVIESIKKEAAIYKGEPFKYVGGERVIKGQWQITDEHRINFKMIIDRLDRLKDDTLRLIDYKTGSDEVSIGKYLYNVFTNHKLHGVFQLMLYAEAYHDMEEKNMAQCRLALHVVKDIVRTGEIEPITHNKKPINPWTIKEPSIALLDADMAKSSNNFREMLNMRIRELFDPSVPFTQCAEDDNCSYCPFAQLCMREPKDFSK